MSGAPDGIEGSGALAGIVVIELAGTLAGEFAGGVLVDLGATVIKVEPPAGSPMRRRGRALPGEDSLYFQSENRGKYSICADLPQLATTPWFRELLEVADGLIEDLGSSGLERAGLHPDSLHAVNPRLALLRLSPFGQSGPLAEAPGDDRTAQAYSGAQFITGFTDLPPAPITVPMADCWSGVMGAAGLLMAVLAARRSGAGQQIDLALYETLLRSQGGMVLKYGRDGEVAQRSGNINPGVVPGNVFPTADGGFVGLSGAGDKPFQRLCEAIEAPEAAHDPRFATGAERRKHRAEANALVGEWIGRHTLAEVEARFMEFSVAGAAVRSADEIVGDPHVEARGALLDLTSTGGVPFRAPAVVPKLSLTPARAPQRAPRLGEHTAVVTDLIAALRARRQTDGSESAGRPPRSALDGVRVVDISQALNGPWAACILADLGAEVIMVEIPQPSAPRRQLAGGEGLGFLVTNRNKASVSVDVRTEEGRAAVLDLIRVSDVLVENFRPGTLERWGLSPEVLLAANPGLVIVRSSGFGQSGPYAGRASFNPVATAFGGVTYLGGSPERPPLRDGITAGDYTPALFNVLGSLAALIRRDHDGLGQVVDVAMVEAALRMTGDTIALKTALGVRQERAGGAWPAYPISLTLATSDGRHIALSAQSTDELTAVVAALGLEAPATAEEATAVLRAFVGAHSAADATAVLREAGARCSVVNSVADLFDEEHLWQRGSLVRAEDPELGSVATVGVVPKLSRTPGRLHGWSRARGSENAAILSGLLGYEDERVSSLTEGRATPTAPA